jgi:hypothetical protein
MSLIINSIHKLTESVAVEKKRLNMLQICNCLFLIVFLMLMSCSYLKKDQEKDPVTGKTKRIEPNVYEKQKKWVEKEGSVIFGGGKDPSNSTAVFASNNVLWKATLKTFKTVPLLTSDFAGGIIVTDWYGNINNGTGEQIKITVNFVSSKLSASSIEVTSHKKICKDNVCNTQVMDESFSNKIKSKIVDNIKLLRIEQETVKKK